MLLLMFFNMTYRSHCDVGTGFVTFAGGAQNLSVTFCHVALSGRRNSDVTRSLRVDERPRLLRLVTCVSNDRTLRDPPVLEVVARVQPIRFRPTLLQKRQQERRSQRRPVTAQRTRPPQSGAPWLTVPTRRHHRRRAHQARAVPVGALQSVVPVASQRTHADGTHLLPRLHLPPLFRRVHCTTAT